ncbi:OB-fold nucleic acid binding domain-containing protein [Roseospira navarrensis]|uniref:Bacterial OB-fold domain-containing protein n=1 Tax=Roseospira navarrensis TaxID=140058 RepID=A0A7X1ZFL4_9PROT|nr:OB-fold nucleic acid binding domain-containing protein [Roseospira navarrensis]MQX37452.1 hypothetical protein [Roseospira navarrensis]
MKRTIQTIAMAAATTTIIGGAAMAEMYDYPRDTTVNGRVTAVNEQAGTFTVADRFGEVDVYVNRLGDNPLDDVGRVKIETDDVVSASGMISVDEEDQDREMHAGRVSVHIDASSKAN